EIRAGESAKGGLVGGPVAGQFERAAVGGAFPPTRAGRPRRRRRELESKPDEEHERDSVWVRDLCPEQRPNNNRRGDRARHREQRRAQYVVVAPLTQLL